LRPVRRVDLWAVRVTRCLPSRGSELWGPIAAIREGAGSRHSKGGYGHWVATGRLPRYTGAWYEFFPTPIGRRSSDPPRSGQSCPACTFADAHQSTWKYFGGATWGFLFFFFFFSMGVYLRPIPPIGQDQTATGPDTTLRNRQAHRTRLGRGPCGSISRAAHGTRSPFPKLSVTEGRIFRRSRTPGRCELGEGDEGVALDLGP